MNLASVIILTIFVFPVLAIVVGILGYYFFKNVYTTPMFVAFIALTATFTVFNASFWFWAVLYTLLAFLSGLFVKLFFSKQPTAEAATSPRKHRTNSYMALALGIVCFFVTFVQPTRIVMIGSLVGDYTTYGLTIIGFIFSIIGLSKRSERNVLPLIALVLSLSFPIYFVLWFILLITGVIPFAP